MIGAILGLAGLVVAGLSAWSSHDSQTQQLELQKESLELEQEVNLQSERQDILAQANSAAMAIDNLGQSVEEAGFYQSYYSKLASQISGERDDALSQFDTGAAQTLGSQKVALALSGAKLSTGSNLEVAASTAANLGADRSTLESNYNSEIQNQNDMAGYYGRAKASYNEQIGSYDTLLTEIYNANTDWLYDETAGEYGGAYGDWLKKRDKRTYLAPATPAITPSSRKYTKPEWAGNPNN